MLDSDECGRADWILMLLAMSTALAPDTTLADLLRDLGGISSERIRLRPPPGKDDDRVVISQKQTLTGGAVLPGFKLRLRDLFAVLDDME